MRKLLVAACAAFVVAGFALVGTAGAGENHPQPSQHIVSVTKVVTGDVPDEASYVVDVCGTSLNFNQDGGTQSVTVGDYFDGNQTCAVSEPNNGGASNVSISGSPCEFTGRERKYDSNGSDVNGATPTYEQPVYPDQTCSVTITNHYDKPDTPDVTNPPAVVEVPGPPVIVQAPAPRVIVATPTTTG